MHRVGQFVAHVRARVDPAEEGFVRRVLPPAASSLFAGMPVADRRHALDVAHRLVIGGNDDPELLSAALLHDAAKGHQMRLGHRVTGVLLEWLTPALLRRLANPDSGSWRHPFHLYLHHAPMSADLAQESGCSPRVGAFIRGTSDEADAQLLAALKVADDAG